MNQRESGRQRGREAAADRAKELPAEMTEQFAYARTLFPSLEGEDLGAMVRDYDRERLACEPDYAKFPEMRGLIDRHVAEREAFRQASGLDETATAFQYSWSFLLWRRINANHPAYWNRILAEQQCTNVFFPAGKDGVTMSDNRDLAMDETRGAIPSWRPTAFPWSNPNQWLQGAASSAIVMDEEPECSFLCDPDELIPEEEAWEDIEVRMAFMDRYREFWGPTNQIWTDKHLNAVAVDKSNCRVAYRRPEVNGAVCVTACSYLDPELHAFKQERMRLLMKAKGETEDTCPDWSYDLGSRSRYQRLCKLTNAAAAIPDGPSIWDALDVVADEAVPYPERICLSGQDNVTWSSLQHAGVTSGPKRRWLFRMLDDLDNPGTVTEKPLQLMLGKDVEMQPEWQADIDAGRCTLASPEA